MNGVYAHPTALVETQHIGHGTYIWAFTHVMSKVSIGSNCNIGDHCFIESEVAIGDNVTIKNGNMLWTGVVLEDGVFVGPHVFFTNDRHPRSPRLPQARKRYRDRAWLLPTLVKQGASLGSGAVLLPGITIGEFGMVGAGAVVTKDVAPYTLVSGNPARPRGWVCQCGQPLWFQQERASCGDCGLRFVRAGHAIELQETV